MAAVFADGGHVAPSVAVSTAVLRGVVLLVTAAVAAWRLRRGREGDAFLVAAVGAVVCGTSPLLLVHRVAVTLWMAAAAAWVVPPRRTGTAGVGIVAGATTAVTGAWLAVGDRVRLDGLVFDRLVLVEVALLVAAVVLGLRRSVRLELAVLTAAAAVGSALLLVPTAPPAGRPVLTAAGPLPVSVVPQRPGPNWVHVDSDRPVTVDGVRSRALPGATGQWAQVTLPTGRSSLQIKQIGAAWEQLEGGDVLVDAGDGAPVAVDGPECASVWTAAALAGRTPSSCPSQLLSPADSAALTALVSWLADRHVRGVTVLGDDTPRSRQASAVVSAAATRHGLSGHGSVVVTSGWERAAAQLTATTAPADGVYLAPWLVSGPFLSQQAELAPLAVLPFDPAGQQAQRYAAALPAGEVPTAAGFAAWGGRDAAPRVFASAPVSILPPSLGHEHAGRGWFPGGALTPVTGRLPGVGGLS